MFHAWANPRRPKIKSWEQINEGKEHLVLKHNWMCHSRTVMNTDHPSVKQSSSDSCKFQQSNYYTLTYWLVSPAWANNGSCRHWGREYSALWPLCTILSYPTGPNKQRFPLPKAKHCLPVHLYQQTMIYTFPASQNSKQWLSLLAWKA